MIIYYHTMENKNIGKKDMQGTYIEYYYIMNNIF